MKNLIAIIMGITLIFAVNNGFTQKNNTNTEPLKIKAEVEKLILRAEANIKKPYKLNAVMYEFGKNRVYKKYADTKTKRDVTMRLIKIYDSLNDVGVNQPSKERIIETIGHNDNSIEAHKFFLKVLNSNSNEYRRSALWSLNNYNGVHGNDIYDEITRLMKKGVIDKEKFLYALKNASPKKALPEIQKIVSSTKNPKLFQMAGRLLCEYKDVNLLDNVVERYDYFKNIPISEQPDHYNPSFVVTTEILEKYIEATEGKKLRKALEILTDTNVFGELYWLETKFGSQNIDTREAVINFIENQMSIGNVSEEKVSPILKEALSYETNKKLKLKLKAVIKSLEDKSGRVR